MCFCVLAAWAAILPVPKANARAYSLSFEFMAKLKRRYGYFVVPADIYTVCAAFPAWVRLLGGYLPLSSQPGNS